jgi:RNA polymerase sigma-70 factor (ECF subfamily)
MSRTADLYAELRPLLFSIAYRMLGTVAEAEDVVQDAFLRFERALDAGTEIESPKAYLSATATRLAIDHLRSARVRRERYTGTWLPEPLVTDEALEAVDEGDGEHEATADSLSLAFLVVLESLTPVERAVFLLREVFDQPYDEIARVVGKSEENCRRLAARARRHVDERRPRFEASRRRREELARRFFAAADSGDPAELVELLAADVVLYGDGGGKAPAIPRPIFGRRHVATVLAAWAEQGRRAGVRLEAVELNGQPGARVLDREGRLVNVLALDIADGLVQAVRSIINPEKLGHLGPVADARGLLRAGRPA